MFSKNDPVYIGSCDDYTEKTLQECLLQAISLLGFKEKIKDRAVVIKPNLVRKMDPALGGTTHPVMLRALILLLWDLGAKSVTIAESPGGIYNTAALQSVYEGCGIGPVARETGAILNFDLSSSTMSSPKGEKTKNFEVIDPIRNADLIINLCKLKSHGMMTLSCAAKNLFGVIPGVLKFEMHARFPKDLDFGAMLADLNEALHSEREILSICDGIVGMEGNGPTSGDPVRLGVVLASANPFNLDLAACGILKMEELPVLVAEGVKRGYSPKTFKEVCYVAAKPESFAVSSFKLPDSKKKSALQRVLTLDGGRYARFFEPRPVINKKDCRGCGECVRSCPQKTIYLYTDKKGKKKAKIKADHCIKCYCCQELCPFKCVDIVKSPLIDLVNRL